MKEDSYTDIICKRFCAFYREGKEEFQCGTYLYLKEQFSAEDLRSFLADMPEHPDHTEDDLILSIVCNKCDFLVDGCDYREGLDSPPCGGYIIVEHLIKKGALNKWKYLCSQINRVWLTLKGGFMLLYLVRHGEAKDKDEDPGRSLSNKGIDGVNKVARALSEKNVTVASIFHSGKKRAKQTAQIIAEAISPAQGISEQEGLKPNDDPSIWSGKIEGIEENIMLVGHLPHLDVLTSQLLGRGSVRFSAGQAICLERDPNGSWTLKWTIAPDDID
jgi:phosphohistidine phosphatase